MMEKNLARCRMKFQNYSHHLKKQRLSLSLPIETCTIMLSSLPVDVMKYLFQFLNGRDLALLCSCSKYLRSNIDSDDAVWADLFKLNYPLLSGLVNYKKKDDTKTWK